MNSIEIFLSSINMSPPGSQWSFLWNERFPNSTIGAIGFDFYIDWDKKNRASLLLINEYPNLLEGMSIKDASDILSDFFKNSIKELQIDSIFFSGDRKKNILEQIDPNKLKVIKSRLDKFLKDKIRQSIFMMPVSGIPCLHKKDKGNYMWVEKDFQKQIIIQQTQISENYIDPNFFPPFKEMSVKYYPLSSEDSWFIVRARDSNLSETYFRRMVGALSVIIKHPHSRLITGREVQDGRAEIKFDGVCCFNLKESLVPAVSLPTKYIDNAGIIFWNLLSEKTSKRVKICLEYLSDSWGKSQNISFINTSIAMDALFGVNGKVNQSILEGVGQHSKNISNSSERYKLILKIRNDILHGECSTIEASAFYLKYYDKFNSSPISDQISILNDCLIDITKT